MPTSSGGRRTRGATAPAAARFRPRPSRAGLPRCSLTIAIGCRGSRNKRARRSGGKTRRPVRARCSLTLTRTLSLGLGLGLRLSLSLSLSLSLTSTMHVSLTLARRELAARCGDRPAPAAGGHTHRAQGPANPSPNP